MENGKLLNMGPMGTKEYIIKQFHIRKGQDQNHIYVFVIITSFSHFEKRIVN